MDLNIEGNPGSNNHFEENQIEKVDALCPNATKVLNDHSVTVQINFSLNINLNGERAVSLFTALRRRFHLTIEKLQSNHFDGEGRLGTTACQFNGSPTAIAAALRGIYETWGEDAAETIRYTSRNTGFERGRLTLPEALRIVEDESGL
ncbi:MAG TPA: hypothetical protein H9966_09115 [Candidatus Prevotella avicola]|uniref:Uncharacterized protein n=1 Tax=Candidatus Prevotella avicola TaxID=2838738 RepID=A0A9D2G0L3_9BACT|nr:hypothetical protein [Candidatus Prevotella avicola]